MEWFLTGFHNLLICVCSFLILLHIYFSAEIQIIGMSATLGNLCDLQEFLHAEIYCNDFRPVSFLDHRFTTWDFQLWIRPVTLLLSFVSLNINGRFTVQIPKHLMQNIIFLYIEDKLCKTANKKRQMEKIKLPLEFFTTAITLYLDKVFSAQICRPIDN